MISGFLQPGVLRMRDAGEGDDKIIGVPADDVDPHYVHVRDVGGLPPAQRRRLEAFFRVYKDLPAGPAANPVRVHGFGDAAEASALIGESLRRKAEAARAAPGCVGTVRAAG